MEEFTGRFSRMLALLEEDEMIGLFKAPDGYQVSLGVGI